MHFALFSSFEEAALVLQYAPAAGLRMHDRLRRLLVGHCRTLRRNRMGSCRRQLSQARSLGLKAWPVTEESRCSLVGRGTAAGISTGTSWRGS